MNLRTEIRINAYDFQLEPESLVLTFGSCFSDVIGNFLCNNKFNALSNPYGTVYNLKSMADILESVMNPDWQIDRTLIIEQQGIFFHYGFHSEISGETEKEIVKRINQLHKKTAKHLANTNFLIITLGTSWVYEKNSVVVSNCHKIPASTFSKRLLSYQEQKDILESLVTNLQQFNPSIKIILTVSPVRHIKDGISENSISKAILRMLCDHAVSKISNVYYFPSYEVMIDDLRDYRFYKEDLIHPTQMAEDYITALFSKAVFSEETLKILEEWSKIRTALNHKPFNPKSEAHQSFLINLQKKIKMFQSHFDVSDELELVEAKLIRT